MLARLFGRTTITPQERELLTSLRTIPNPDALRAQLATLQQQIESAETEWDQLDRRGDAAGYLKLQPLAERIARLQAQAAPLPAAIASAERRREAFLALVRQLAAVAADVGARVNSLLEHPPQDARQRDAQLRALDQATRIHGRLAGRLAAMSASRQFRDPPDALRVLRDDLEARMRELDRLRVPGMKPALTWPPQTLELLDVVEDRTSRKETA